MNRPSPELLAARHSIVVVGSIIATLSALLFGGALVLAAAERWKKRRSRR